MCGRQRAGGGRTRNLTHPPQVAGELTRSASRTFYGSFQDATSFAEFSRSWNLLVHDWLRRYVFEPTASASGSPSVAVSVTFIVSIAVHEMVMFAALKPSYRYVPWLALFSLAQLPLYALARHPALHGKRAGNLFFWSGLSLVRAAGEGGGDGGGEGV